MFYLTRSFVRATTSNKNLKIFHTWSLNPFQLCFVLEFLTTPWLLIADNTACLCLSTMRFEITERHLLLEFRINPLNAELIPICHVLALLEPHHILHVSRIRVKLSVCSSYFSDVEDEYKCKQTETLYPRYLTYTSAYQTGHTPTLNSHGPHPDSRRLKHTEL